MKRKVIPIFLIITLLFVILTGCNSTLKEEEVVIASIESSIPNAELIKTETMEIDGDGTETQKNYTFSNGIFEFTYEDYLYDDVFGYSNCSSCNYVKKIINYEENKLNKVFEKYDIKVFNRYSENYSYEKLQEFWEKDGALLFIDECASTFGMEIDVRIEKYSDIKNVYNCLEEVADVIEKYLPIENNDIVKFNFNLKIDHKKQIRESDYNNKNIYNDNRIITRDTLNIRESEKWVKYIYAEAVKRGMLDEAGIDTSKVKTKTITKLYVNDELFTSEKYETKFYYNLEDDTYYTVVCFGQEFEYNGGVKDYLQREIIEEYYPKSNYTIENGKDQTTYKIGKNTYKVKWTTDLFESIEDDDYMIFYKNGKDMKIKNINEFGNISAGATYYRMISVKDFAKIMEMNVEKIDWENGAIYLTTE